MEAPHWVALGTASGIKIDAVRLALTWQFGAAAVHRMRIEGLEVESAVSEQPVGRREIEAGARHRAREAARRAPGADIYVGLENGMWLEDVCQGGNGDAEAREGGGSPPPPRWVDGAAIAVLRPARGEGGSQRLDAAAGAGHGTAHALRPLKEPIGVHFEPAHCKLCDTHREVALMP